MAQTLLLLLPLASAMSSSPSGLASFDQLRDAWLKSGSTLETIQQMEERGDRSLAGTYPFNLNTGSSKAVSHHQPAPPVVAARAPAHHQAAHHHQALPAPVHHQAASSHHQEPLTPAFSLSAGFGSRSSPRNQYQIGPAPFRTPPVRAPVPSLTYQGYQNPAYGEVAAAYNPSATPTIALAPSACPSIAGLPISQCAGAVNACWSVGQADVDCPNNGLCCFNGCANACQPAAPAPAPAPAPLPAHTFALAPAPLPALPVPAPAHQDAVVVEAPPVHGLPVPRPTAARRRIAVKRVRPKNPHQARQPLPSTAFRDVAAAKERCIDKIETVEEIEYDEVEQCDHSYDQKCHTTYVTEYESQQEEECKDNFKKSCEITYSPSALNVTVEVCMQPLVKDCNLSGPEVCRTEYISECWTKNDPHLVEDDVPRCQTIQEEKCIEVTSGYTTANDCKKWPREVCTVTKELKTKFNPVTKCEKVPQELCGPSGCGFRPGPEICHDEVKTVVTDIPQEVCDLQPRRSCEHVTKLVPKLSPVEECVDVPKEICTKAKVNPRTVQKPITKKWCYIPSEESGLL